MEGGAAVCGESHVVPCIGHAEGALSNVSGT